MIATILTSRTKRIVRVHGGRTRSVRKNDTSITRAIFAIASTTARAIKVYYYIVVVNVVATSMVKYKEKAEIGSVLIRRKFY